MRLIPLAAAALLAVPVALAAQTAPYSGTWSDLPALPQYQGEGAALLSVTPNLLVFLPGGGTQAAFRYSAPGKTWTPMPALAHPLGRGGSVTLRPGTSTIHVFGGNYSNAFFEYDHQTGASRDLAAPTASLYVNDGHQLVATADRTYLFLNQEQQPGELGAFLEYAPDPVGLGAWTRRTGPAIGSGLASNGLSSLANAGNGFLFGVRKTTRQLVRYALPAGPWVASDDPGAVIEALPEIADSSGVLSRESAAGCLTLMIGDRFRSALYRLETATGKFTSVAELPFLAGQDGSLTFPSGSFLFVTSGYGCTLRTFDTTASAFVTTLAPLPEPLSYGGDLVSVGTGRELYAIAGLSGTLLRYDIAGNRWEDKGALPIGALSGSDLVYDGGDFLYATHPQSNVVKLNRYALNGQNAYHQVEGTWMPMASLYKNSSNGGQAVHAGGRIHYFPGGSREVHEFTPPLPSDPEGATGSWALASTAGFTTKNRGVGCAAVCPAGGTKIYLSWGNSTTIFASYDIGTGAWAAMDGSRTAFTWGAALAHPGTGNYLYAMSGGTPSAWAFELPSAALPLGTWHALPSAPGDPTKGSALVHPGRGNFLYALQGGTTTLWRYRFSPPPTLASIGQFTPQGAPVGQGGLLPARSFTATGVVTDDDPFPVKLEIKVKPAGQPFVEADPVTAAGTSGPVDGPLLVSVAGLAPGTGYHWLLRSINDDGECSDWIPFGSVPEDSAEKDLETAPNRAPTLTGAGQYVAPSGLAIEPGGRVYDAVRFSGEGADEDGDAIELQVELVTVDANFHGTATVTSGYLPAGDTLTVTAPPESGDYRWSWRVVDEWNGASAWTSFGTGGPDFRIDASGSIGTACLGSAGGSACVIAAFTLFILTRRVRCCSS